MRVALVSLCLLMVSCGSARHWIGGGLLAGGAAFAAHEIVKKNDRQEGVPVSESAPASVGTLRRGYPAVLIAPDMALYVWHVFKAEGGPNDKRWFTFNGQRVDALRFDKVHGQDLMLCRIPAVDIPPAGIADTVTVGEPVTIYTKDRGIKLSTIRRFSESTVQVWYNAQPGDSSSVVLNSQKQVVTLLTTGGGSGPRLDVIKQKLLEP